MGRRTLVAVTVALALGGCGSDDPQTLNSAFEQDIAGANVTIELEFGSGRVGLAGPFVSDEAGNLPNVDWRIKQTAPGAALNLSGARIVSGPNKAFVIYRGETYELPDQDIEDFRSGPRGLIHRMRAWFPESDAPVETTLDGEPVTRFSGRLDVKAAAQDLKALGRQNGLLFAGLEKLTGADVRKLAPSANDARFTVDVGRADGKLRRIEWTLPLQASSVKFTVRFKDIDKTATIDAPVSGLPFEALVSRMDPRAPAGDGGDLRHKIAAAHKQVADAYARWESKVDSASDEETVGETRRFVIVLRSVRDVVARARGGTAKAERLRLDYVHAADAFARALSAFADALESGSQKQLDRALKQVQRTGPRYDAIVERATR